MKKEEEPITTFIWCGAVVKVYVQVVKLAGTTIQRHLLPTNLRKAVNEEVAKAGNLPEDSPRLTGKELKLLLEWLSVLRVTV
ncbi:TPA: hypothetical protein ACF24Z_004472 [Klebsiella pneumoniae]